MSHFKLTVRRVISGWCIYIKSVDCLSSSNNWGRCWWDVC